MAKEEENGVVDINTKTGRIRVPLQQLLLLLGVSGLTVGGLKLSEGKPPEALAAPAIETVSSFMELRGDVNAHHRQQEKDAATQVLRDADQDRHLESVNEAVNMLNQSLVRIETQTEEMHRQTARIEQMLQRHVQPRNSPQP